MSRRFNQAQKEALYYIANSRCELCGIDLPPQWHADHKIPFTAGGTTDVLNGQALCPTCNLRKGAKSMVLQWPNFIHLRPWQEEFIGKYNAENKENFLLVATPGAGKTTASLRVAYELLKSGTVKRIVVVCPTDHLRTQWLEEAHKLGIPLDKLITSPWSKQVTQTDDVFGLVTTYAQVANKIDILRLYTGREKTLVIFDEIHHCGDKEYLAWGRSIKEAFEPAIRRLLLSGTPFRSDNTRIPFVDYVPIPSDPLVSQSVADHTYGYGDALKDENVVRHIVFPSWDGRLIWENFGETKQATFKDSLNQTDSRHRLRTALDHRGEWIKQVILAANEKLDYIRREEGHKNAGGLIVTPDQDSAKALAALLKTLTGENCTLAISESDDASADIARFRDSDQKWIVAIKMVSEGVDIKRLRIGVYATNVLTRTYFRQVIGRVIRWDSRWNHLDDQTAWFYLPEDPTLIALAKEIKVEITDTVRQQEKDDQRGNRDSQGDGKQMTTLQMELNTYEFKYSEGEESDHIFNGQAFSKNELQEAEKIFSLPGFERVTAAAKANALRVLRFNEAISASDVSLSSITNVTPPKHVQKQDLKSIIRTKVGRLVHVCQQNGIYIPGKSPHQAINNAWGKRQRYSHESTSDDLGIKLKWLEGLIERALQGDKSITQELS